jgi:hypothetical protein
MMLASPQTSIADLRRYLERADSHGKMASDVLPFGRRGRSSHAVSIASVTCESFATSAIAGRGPIRLRMR